MDPHTTATPSRRIRALHNNQWNFDRHMSLPPRAKSELECLVENVMTGKNSSVVKGVLIDSISHLFIW